MFSSEQDNCPAEKSASNAVVLSVTEKFEDAPENNRGISVPRVACWKFPIVDVVQSTADLEVQFAPVNPLVQIHWQELDEITEMPPFEQGVEEAQFERGLDGVEGAALSLGSTMSTMGITTAAAIRRNRIRRTMRNPQSGKPQHLLLGRFSSLASNDRAILGLELTSGEGHLDGGPSRVGVLTAGGGKESSMSEREFRGWSSESISFSI